MKNHCPNHRPNLAVNILTLFILPLCTLSAPLAVIQVCAASEQVGTLTQVQGVVKLFSHPSKSLPKEQGDSTRALFEGEYFLVHDAKLGDPVEKGNILRTSPGAQARVVFNNGDQINVAPATAYRITWDQDSSKGKTEVQLAYGKIRGIVTQGGPRSRLIIKTKSAVMGIRGTDFSVTEGEKGKTTELTVMRGSVEIRTNSTQVAPTVVEAGYSAKTKKSTLTSSTSMAKVEPKIELRQTTQEEFIGIQKFSTIQKRELASVPSHDASQETQTQIEQLEKKAAETVLKDIQKHDQALYARLEKDPNKPNSLEQINQATIQKLYKEAPKAPAQRKPYQKEMDDIKDGAYEKYFKRVE